MNLKEELLQLSSKIVKLKDQILTEEATNTAFVLPFLQALGYDIFNPNEIEPEHTSDIGIKKGEKIDYAIKHRGEPIILVECKHWKQDLNLHYNQLFRYYVTSKARFAVLTNGIQYRFFCDTEKTNIMDTIPFFEINITEINEYQIEQLIKFHKFHFDEQYIWKTIPSIKYIKEMINNFAIEKTRYDQKLENISAEVIRMNHQLEHKQQELNDCKQKITELENSVRVQEIPPSKSNTEDDELDSLIEYLNMPVPSDWREKTLQERKYYWNNERNQWRGKPREYVCNTEVAREFYEYERKEVTVSIGRKISDAIERTGLFYRDGSKKRFGEYGSAIAWIRKTGVPKAVTAKAKKK